MKQKMLGFAAICFSLFLLFNIPASAKSPSVADFLCEIGIKYYKQGEYKEALHELEKALLVEPEHAQALKYIQLVKQELGLVQEKAEEISREEAMARALEEAEAKIAPELPKLPEIIEEAEAEIIVEEEISPTPPEKILSSAQEAVEEKIEALVVPEIIEEAAAEPIVKETQEAKAPVEIKKPPVLEVSEEKVEASIVPEIIEEAAAEPIVEKVEAVEVKEEAKAKIIEEEEEQDRSGKISGEVLLSLGHTSDDKVIWRDANGDYNEANWRRIDENFGVNTYDTRVYDRVRVNVDTNKKEGFNFHSNITIDPWSFIGKSNKVRVTSLVTGESAEVQLKYWSATKSIINESVDFTTDVFSIPEVKVKDGKVAPFTAKGIEFVANAYDEVDIPELEIHEELWPIRELWLDYNRGDRLHFRFFPIAYQDQALNSDDPLQLSNHMIYWEESPWLDRWQKGRLHTDVAPTDFTRGQWEDDLSFFTRDSNMVRLTSLRGFSMKSKPWENLSIESTTASPKGLWQDYESVDNVEGATRIKLTPNDKFLLGLIHTFRYGLDGGTRDAENRVAGADICYKFASGFEIKAEGAHSWDERDITQEPYDTEEEGNAYRFELKKGKVKEERPEKWDKEAQEKAEPFDYAIRLTCTRMEEEFYPALANYRLTRRDSFWGRHIHFREPYKEYYGGLYYPSLTWEDIRPFRIGDSVDIDRDVVSLRLEKAFFGGNLETLFDCRRAHEVSRGKYIETVGRTEAEWQANERLLIKFLALYHDLPETTGGIDPIIYDVDSNKFLLNDEIENGADPSLKTVSTGFKYDFFDWLSFDCIYEYTNDFTLGLDEYPRRLLNNPGFTTTTEYGLIWREPAPWLYNNYLFPLPDYPWFSIYKGGLELEPNDDLKFRLEFTKNDYKFASQIDDNINHCGFEADWDITERLSLQVNYTYSKSYNLWKQVNDINDGALEYEKHHNVFVNLDYKIGDKGVFTVQFGEGALLPYSTMYSTSPYPGFLPTLDTAHIVRAYFSRKF